MGNQIAAGKEAMGKYHIGLGKKAMGNQITAGKEGMGKLVPVDASSEVTINQRSGKIGSNVCTSQH